MNRINAESCDAYRMFFIDVYHILANETDYWDLILAVSFGRNSGVNFVRIFHVVAEKIEKTLNLLE